VKCIFVENSVKMTHNQTTVAEIQPISIAEIKSLFPNEWVLISDPVMDETEFHVLSGIPLFHSKDKKEVAHLGRPKVVGYETYTLIYTGVIKPTKKIISLYSRPPE